MRNLLSNPTTWRLLAGLSLVSGYALAFWYLTQTFSRCTSAWF